jgi:formate transporter
VSGSLPPLQHVRAALVIDELATFGRERLDSFGPLRVLTLAVLAGGFITIGGLLSVLLAAGIATPGPQRLVEGVAFSAGFFFVVLSEAVLFTEANVVLPATLLETRHLARRISTFWAIAWIGNLLGAILTAHLVAVAQTYPRPVIELLGDVIDAKLQYADVGGAAGWFQLVLSGVLANWLVGMAAFFATMGRTIFGRYIPILLAVTTFVAAGFQHSPANMGYFALWMAETGQGPGWATALGWNIIPAGIGNMLGAAVFVALPFWYVYRPSAT